MAALDSGGFACVRIAIYMNAYSVEKLLLLPGNRMAGKGCLGMGFWWFAKWLFR
jgi:hypothetical protein